MAKEKFDIARFEQIKTTLASVTPVKLPVVGTSTFETMWKVLFDIASLWPPDACSADILAVYGINDGKQRAILLDAAVQSARKTLAKVAEEVASITNRVTHSHEHLGGSASVQGAPEDCMVCCYRKVDKTSR